MLSVLIIIAAIQVPTQGHPYHAISSDQHTQRYQEMLQRRAEFEQLYDMLMPLGWEDFDEDNNGRLSDEEEMEMDSALGND